MCEQCRANAAKASGVAKQEVERVRSKIEELINQDAETQYHTGNPPHPFTHAEALTEHAALLVGVPLMDMMESGDVSQIASAEELMMQADVFNKSVQQALAHAGTVNNMPTMAGVIGLLMAAKELLEGFHLEVEDDMKAVGFQDAPTGTDVADLLKGFLQGVPTNQAAPDDVSDLLKNFMKANGSQ